MPRDVRDADRVHGVQRTHRVAVAQLSFIPISGEEMRWRVKTEDSGT
jgi:hypothetical protein